MKTTVTLTGPEMWLAGITGLARYIEARVNNRKPLNGQDVCTAAGDDVIGAMAEAAFAKHLGIYWLGEWLNHKTLDVGEFQVRHTKYITGKLLIQPGDDPDQKFMLVTGPPPTFTIVGWKYAGTAKQEDWWDTKFERPCYAVEQEYLEPIN